MSAQPPERQAPGYTGPVPPGAQPAGIPAQPGPPMPPALGGHVLSGYGRRVVATLIDLAIIAVGAVGIMALFGAVFSVGFFAGETAGIVSVIVGLLIGVFAFALIALLYAPLIMWKTNGKTLGKMAAGIRVIRADGRPMDFGWSAYREVVIKIFAVGILNAITAGLPWATLADCGWPLWDDQNRALHDIVCDTRVVVD